MKAETKYNDLLGTSAADIVDGNDLKTFLESRGVDVQKYVPIGVALYGGSEYSGCFYPSFICQDTETASLVRLKIPEVNINDFFELFKRFEFILSQEKYINAEINKEVSLDSELCV